MEHPITHPVAYSRTTITELMIPSYANFGGKIHGGILLSLMDKVAYVCAAKHAGGYCVTVTVDGVEFLQPVEVGDLVSLVGCIHYVGRTSLVVGIEVHAENVVTGKVTHTNTSYFTMVHKNADDKPTEVPALYLETREEVLRFLKAIKRRELKAAYKQQMKLEAGNLAVAEALESLKAERCVLGELAEVG